MAVAISFMIDAVSVAFLALAVGVCLAGLAGLGVVIAMAYVTIGQIIRGGGL